MDSSDTKSLTSIWPSFKTGPRTVRNIGDLLVNFVAKTVYLRGTDRQTDRQTDGVQCFMPPPGPHKMVLGLLVAWWSQNTIVRAVFVLRVSNQSCPVTSNVHIYSLQCTTFSVAFVGNGVARWLTGRASDLRSRGRGFETRPRRCCATTLGKLFTPHCRCHQAV